MPWASFSPNASDSLVPEMVTDRTMACHPLWRARYRLVDFMLSSMVNSGISNVSLVVKQNYHSLMDHLGTGREWDLPQAGRAEPGAALCRGGREDVPGPRGGPGQHRGLFGGPERGVRDHVRLNIVFNFDFNQLIEAHISTGADVTVMYEKRAPSQGLVNDNFTPAHAGGPGERAALERLPPRRAEPLDECVHHPARGADHHDPRRQHPGACVF